LLDTGVFLHNELKNRLIYFKDYVNHKTICYDDNGHGTHIAGIISGQCGMAPGSELLVFKVLNKRGDGSTTHAIQALDWLLENYKQYDVRLLNFSMGYMPNADLKLQKMLMERLEALWDCGVTVITAAGNNGPKENSVTVPGISRKVITVGAGEEDYGGRGPTACCVVKPEILAPGTDIRSLATEQGKYVRKSGTSMAAPVVCGALALALEKNPFLTPVELKLLLYDSVRRIPEKSYVWGVLDVDNLMKML
jgi:serine protease AprX